MIFTQPLLLWVLAGAAAPVVSILRRAEREKDFSRHADVSQNVARQKRKKEKSEAVILACGLAVRFLRFCGFFVGSGKVVHLFLS